MIAPVKSSKIVAAVRVALLSSSPFLVAHAATLPIPCTSGACGPGVSSFVSYGAASVAQTGSRLTINQTTTNAILNWQSFNISADGTVQFVQPSATSVALNEIFDSNPSQIFGALDANGRVFLINHNGIIFGQGAQVSVGGLVASTLDISPEAATTSGPNATYLGLGLPGQSANDSPAFVAATDASGNILSKDITVQQGASIQAADGGEIYMFASNVTNLGTIHTPDGQTILAAGSSVYLAQSASSDLRGMLVEVKGSGMVTNGLASNANASSPQQLVGQVIAEHGNISLAALAVNQYGRLSANTSVNENGSIYLEAENGNLTSAEPVPVTGGTLVLGQNSDTEVTLDTADPTQTVDSVAQPKSTIQLTGKTIQMLQGSVARATSGEIDVNAATNFAVTPPPGTSDGSRFYMAQGSVLDVSGASITLPVSDNVISAQLEATELADSPDQRNGPLHGATVEVDTRTHGTNADGSTWWGTPVANVTGEIQAITRNVVERNLTGGTVNIQSKGDVILAPGSDINVSGGFIQYTGGYIDTSQLLTLWGQTVPIGSANPDLPYAGVVNGTTTIDSKWGVKQSYQTTPSYYSPGYVEGKDAGTLDLTAPTFIMDGTVSASTVVGVYQTQPTTVEPATTQPSSMSTADWLAEWSASPWIHTINGSTATAGLYRPYDEVPNGATLQIGTPGGNGVDLVVNGVTVGPGEVLPGLRNADGSSFNPVTDPLPTSLTASTLQPGIIDEFEHVSIYTNGNLVLPPGVDLSLAAGGGFTAQASSIDIEGGIDIPSGTISLTAEPTAADEVDPARAANPETTLTLGSAASLITSGEWINDNAAVYPNGNPAALYINGGSISLTAADPSLQSASADMQLEPGSVIDVTGGAQLTRSSSVVAGKGGSITIDAGTAPVSDLAITSPLPPSSLLLGATLRGYALYDGGRLSISAPGICIAASDCSGGTPSMLWLTPGFFGSGGFASYSLTADQGGLHIAPGTQIDLVQQNLALAADYTMLPDAATLIGMAAPVQLPLQVRQPVDLSLAFEYPDNASITPSNTIDEFQLTSDTPTLTIPQGTVISTDPGGSLSLSSNSRIDVEGTLRAPGGKISVILALNGDNQELQYDPSQAIWLGPDAVLDASGVAKIFPNSLGSLTGSVLQGGIVSLDADVGYLDLLPGSLIDVSGTSGTIDLMPVGGGTTTAKQIASAGGAIDLVAADGAVIGGTLQASAGAAGPGANQPADGTLSLVVDPTGGPAGSPASDTITVTPTLVPTVVAPGAPAPGSLFGQALLPANTIAQGGFSIVALQSFLGAVDLSAGATLTAAEEVSLDAQTYSVDPGTTGTVAAPYVEFGSTSTPWAAGPPAATGGTGVLDVSGGFIELYGMFSLQGIGAASFDSSGDLRVRGIAGPATDDPTGLIEGELYADGTINLTAQQIYPTTLSQFVISADPSSTSNPSQPTGGAIVVKGSPGAPQDVLSAAGSLTLSAASIIQDGVLRAPFGTLVLDANSLTLGPGSLTSTSADGLTIPFGITQGGLDWAYPLGNNLFNVYGTDGQPPPAQQIELNGTNINVATGATIDISGGGDLQAYEWIPGPGGSQDVLGSDQSFAVVPSLRTSVAPYDPSISPGSPLQVGEAVYLAGGSGLAAGTYVLLPARYALLPGAYLVTPESGTTYQDMQPGQTFTAGDGGTIVAGYLTTMGLSTASSRWNGFDVTPQSIFMNESQYTTTSGNQFFSAQQAAAEAAAANTAVSAMRLPEDAGVLDLIAGSSLILDGTLRTSAQNGARGAEVDISNPDIVITGGTGGATQSGALVLTAASLNQIGAQTLLIGGEDADGAIDTTAQTVTVADGASLTGPQILLTAQNQVSVKNGASITAAGTAPAASSYSLTGDGVLLAVGSGSQITVARSGSSGTQGTLDLAAGSMLSADEGSIYLDATSVIDTQGTIAVTGGNLAVQAPAIALGNAPAGFQGAVLGQSVFGSGGLGTLLLALSNPQGTPGIQVYDGTSVSAQNIILDAPGIEGYLDPGQTATLAASGTLTLGDARSGGVSSSGSSLSSGTNSGSLLLSASSITLGDALPDDTAGTAQQVTIGGFGSVALGAQGTVNAANDITLATDSDLSITASQVTVASGVGAAIDANGAVSLLSPTIPVSLSAFAPLGGSLAVDGTSIELGTTLDLPSGNVTLSATGTQGITLDAGSAINVAGVTEPFNTSNVATPGGTVSLSAATGAIKLATGSAIDVSAGAGGTGGSLSISSPTGTVAAQGSLAGQGQGASFSIDAQGFDFGALVAAVNAGGFSGAQSYRLRGGSAGSTNDLDLASGQSITAHDVLLESDSGNIDLEGNINASGSSGGQVTVATAGTLTLNGLIDASATSQGGGGGTVELDLTGPGAQLALGGNWGAGAGINVAGGGLSETAAGPDTEAIRPGIGGTVLLRVPAASVPTVAAGMQDFAGTAIRGASSEVLEAYQTASTQGDLSIDSTAISNYQAMAQSIMSSGTTGQPSAAVSAVATLDAAGWDFTLEPGIEVDATGSIAVNSTWDLSDSSSWRYPDATGVNDIPGILTLRAAGGVTFNDSLSDGFTGYAQGSSSAGTLMSQSSWSYRIVAGADLAAADPLAVTATPGDVTIGSATSNGVLVRTGTGFIDVAASGNFVLADPSSVLYTAGSDAGPSLSVTVGRAHHNLPDYSTGGGNISIDVGADVVGAAAANQLVNAWLWRAGTSSGGQTALAWSVNFADFQEGVGALGGGNVTVRAGGNIEDLSASTASIGVQQGGTVDVEDGGQLTVSARQNISGGVYYAGLGSATLTAGGSVTTSGNTNVAPLIALGDAAVSITATGDLTVADIVNPTLLNVGAPESNSFETYYFSTYGAASSANLVSIGGNVELPDQIGAIATHYDSSFVNQRLGPTDTGETVDNGTTPVAEVIFPPVLGIDALSGDIDIGRSVTLFPSSQGNLQMLAAHNVAIGDTSAEIVQIVVPDADPATMPTVSAPVSGSTAPLTALAEIAAPFSVDSSIQHGATPLFQSVAGFDQDPVTLVAESGDVTNSNPSGTSGIWSAKPAIVSAGQDVVDLNLVAQNLTAGDVTSVSAGRDVIYPQTRSTGGVIQPDTNGIEVGGPGELQVSAGRNVNLGTSNGISTIGNTQNTALPSGGAGVSVEAGIGSEAPSYAAFIQQYIVNSGQFGPQLISYVEQITGQAGLTSSEAEQLFDALPASEQRTFVEQLFFSLLKTYGEEAAKSGNNADFAGAYAAIQQLFPGANPDLAKNQTDPYTGDISLYFSRIYTEDGGGISLLAPGGQVNAGLALAPVSYGLQKNPQDLGIVVAQAGDVNSFSYGDFQVNESRVFSADGGNILVWSTEGNIDAGRGSKTSLSAAAPTASYDINDFPSITYFPPTTGSGIQALADTPGSTPGAVDLFAPHGVVNANEAGIVAGNLTIAATAVLGANNISVSGVEVGVPVAVTGLGTQALAGSTSAAGANSSAQSSVSQTAQQQKEAPQATAALRWLDVFVLGFGEDTCSANDLACLKRQKHSTQ